VVWSREGRSSCVRNFFKGVKVSCVRFKIFRRLVSVNQVLSFIECVLSELSKRCLGQFGQVLFFLSFDLVKCCCVVV
jgi:hypothetical protein